ncbi:OTU domain-containing protein 5 [Nilaparvata lugens]|uniref:OTU domain-containing protein 5 n=1 Tax=Nilaparvata lugens TaxID=108931 RepID=UPI00193E05F0|nr:OTU domain-containing protein 5 [Nilaparvata lugens]
MTILSRKKSLQEKSEETTDAPTHHGGAHPHGMGSLPNQLADRNQERLSSPKCWPREEKRQQHVPSTNFDDYDNLSSGPSHSKRHRSSPHRTTRSSKLRERERESSATGNSSPKAGTSASYEDEMKLEAAGGSGYNSGDEYDNRMQISETEWLEKKRGFEKKIRKKGWLIKHMDEDGACLFRAIADQVYGDQEMHAVVRKHCMDYIALNRDFYSQYVTEDFNHYLNRKRQVSTHGNHIEINAMSEMYNRNIEVYGFGKEPMNTFGQQTDNEPIRLSYQSGHYNSIVDPHKATVGVGLGLPSFTPGAADSNLLTDAVRQSEESHIEQTMLEDKLRATDWEATNEAIEEQVARDSYVQWIKDNERKNKAMTSSSTSTACCTSTTGGGSSPPPPPTTSSPKRQSEEASGSNFEVQETASFLNILPPKYLGKLVLFTHHYLFY